ncbi:MAG: dTDP-glucose 4,6-dehydratase [Magnetospirillum sp.]|nr:dTDP-glucose 4,6-dehydratase [Magnetospirillum sp.]
MVTGGSGFIGSALIHHLIASGHDVVNLDKQTYAANPASLAGLEWTGRYLAVQADVADPAAVHHIFRTHQPQAVIHLAAESHVDRSIDSPLPFIATNVTGTAVMLEAAREYWQGLPPSQRQLFRLLHVSTDEVFGSLGPQGRFHEASPYRPNSPYAASKAAADHLARAWHVTYGLPVIISNCSNNYGPRQFPEKLIPLMILNGLNGLALPVYGDGRQMRDWLHVEDHACGLLALIERGRPGESYLLGGGNDIANLAVIGAVCDALDALAPDCRGGHRRLIRHVADRPGHDRRYAVDTGKAAHEVNWRPSIGFTEGIHATVRWYLDNPSWWAPLLKETSPWTRRLGLAS